MYVKIIQSFFAGAIVLGRCAKIPFTEEINFGFLINEYPYSDIELAPIYEHW
jgi:hypothetical protein